MSNPAKQAKYLDEACAGDEKLRAEVDALLKWNQEAGNSLEVPDADPNATLETSAVPEVSGTVIGRYKLLEKVGEGCLAKVNATDDNLSKIWPKKSTKTHAKVSHYNTNSYILPESNVAHNDSFHAEFLLELRHSQVYNHSCRWKSNFLSVRRMLVEQMIRRRHFDSYYLDL